MECVYIIFLKFIDIAFNTNLTTSKIVGGTVKKLKIIRTTSIVFIFNFKICCYYV